jgi:hypothetical protein
MAPSDLAVVLPDIEGADALHAGLVAMLEVTAPQARRPWAGHLTRAGGAQRSRPPGERRSQIADAPRIRWRLSGAHRSYLWFGNRAMAAKGH